MSRITAEIIKTIQQMRKSNQSTPLEYRSLVVELIYRGLETQDCTAYFDGPMYLIRSTDEESRKLQGYYCPLKMLMNGLISKKLTMPSRLMSA